MTIKNTFIDKQKGAALILSLLILLVMTLIGVTAMQTTTMEERMAGNMNEMNIGLQTAEATLRAGEADLEGLFNTNLFATANNHYYAKDTAPDPFNSTTWASGSADSAAYTAIDPGNGNYGRYIIEETGTINSGGVDDLNQCNYGEACDSGSATTFRITARGTGKSGTASVVIRSNYGKLF